MAARQPTESQRDALSRARTGQSLSNYPAIYQGFMAKGIQESEIEPRVNVFTFAAWKAQGQVVRKGEHGVRVLTYVPIPEKRDTETGRVVRKAGRLPKASTVFHVSQTKESLAR